MLLNGRCDLPSRPPATKGEWRQEVGEIANSTVRTGVRLLIDQTPQLAAITEDALTAAAAER